MLQSSQKSSVRLIASTSPGLKASHSELEDDREYVLASELSDLPVELIYQITDFLDYEDLFNLSLTSKAANEIALTTFFNRLEIYPKSGWLTIINADLQDQARTSIALRNSFFIKSLECVYYTIFLESPRQGALHEICDMRIFLQRMPSVERFTLSISARPSFVIDKEEFKDLISTLLDLILDKRCEVLHVKGDPPVYLHRRQLLPEANLSGSSRKLCLKTVSIEDDVLLLPPFDEWTISTLSLCSATLTRLSFSYNKIDACIWSAILGITFHLLKDFEIGTFEDDFDPFSAPDFADIEDFLMRHPKIEELSLQGVRLPPADILPMDRPSMPLLPRLKDIRAHASIIIWLLSRVACAGPKSRYPLLKRVFISSSQNPQSYFDYSLFDRGLECLLRNCLEQRAKSGERGSFVPLCLSIEVVEIDGFKEWLENHISSGTSNSIISDLFMVTSLEFRSIFSSDLIDVLPTWLSFFTDLESVKLVYYYSDLTDELLNSPGFKRKLANACPRLKTLILNYSWDTIELAEFRNTGI